MVDSPFSTACWVIWTILSSEFRYANWKYIYEFMNKKILWNTRKNSSFIIDAIFVCVHLKSHKTHMNAIHFFSFAKLATEKLYKNWNMMAGIVVTRWAVFSMLNCVEHKF